MDSAVKREELHDRPCATTIVGVDGSPESDHALEWAGAWSSLLGAIQPVLAWSIPPWAIAPPIPGAALPPGGETFAQLATAKLAAIVAAHDHVPLVDPLVRAGKASRVLSDLASAEGSAVVVGTRSHGAIRDALLGSVGQHTIAHASFPVIVVPLSAGLSCPAERVIVGVDDSDNSLAALRWANEITPPGQSIEVVHSWYYIPREIPDYKPGALGPIEVQEAATLDQAVARFREKVDVGDDRLVPVFTYGDPRRVLAERAGPNDLLVVGARGRGGFAGLVLGSVTTALTHRPAGATVVVPAGS